MHKVLLEGCAYERRFKEEANAILQKAIEVQEAEKRGRGSLEITLEKLQQTEPVAPGR